MSVLCACSEAIQRFISVNGSLSASLSELDSAVYSGLSEAMSLGKEKLQKYAEIISELRALLSEAENRARKAASNASAAAARAASVPATVTTYSKDSQGNTVKKEKPNPDRAAAQAEANSAKRHAAEAQAVVSKIHSAIKSANEKLSRIQSIQNTLVGIQTTEYINLRRAQQDCERASSQARRVLEALESYKSVTIRR